MSQFFVEIETDRFGDLVRKEYQLKIIRKMQKGLPNYQFPEFLRILFEDESEVNTDAE